MRNPNGQARFNTLKQHSVIAANNTTAYHGSKIKLCKTSRLLLFFSPGFRFIIDKPNNNQLNCRSATANKWM